MKSSVLAGILPSSLRSELASEAILVRDSDTLTGQFQVTASSTGAAGWGCRVEGCRLVGLGLVSSK